ncbi:HEAT repeat domain-containing protein [Stigmatella sp. ncwal1]|uniref:HEAT repeat domain-containing protein n=1 Tax=Stigmatella ashevillensis TaxID=2995309 RepID=A0ABT5D0G0_9BACT|nr:HEAT repeat domain-containing protein [Stigmatella ashevillena]MDC0707156.1 HEAT repeat domain-containing protein [Stigmatella ashevillena]
MSLIAQRRLLLGLSAAGLLMALAAAALLLGRSLPALASPGGLSAQPSSSTTSPASVAAAGQRAWSPGTWYRYALQGGYSVRFRSAKLGAQLPPAMRFQIQGDWRVGICSATHERMEVQVIFSPSRFVVDAGDKPALAPEQHGAMLEALATPFFVTFDRVGAARLLHFEPQVDGLSQGLLRSLVASSQVVFPLPLSASWGAAEEDSSGRYLASYRLQAPLQLEKTKLRYTHLITDQGLQPVDASLRVQVRSRTRLTLAREDLWIESLQGEETLEVDSGPDMVIPGAESQVELRLVERGTDASLGTAFRERQPSLLSLPMANPQPLQLQDLLAHHRQILAGRSLKDFIRDLRSLPTETTAQEKARSQALVGLLALFVLEPSSASGVPALLRTRVKASSAGPLIGALSAASTPEAIRALCQIVGDVSLDHEVRMDATSALGAVSTPTEEGLSTLRGLARGGDVPLRETATLGLGSAGMHLRETDERAAAALFHELNTSLASATHPRAQTIGLLALSNTRAPAALPSIQLFLSSGSLEVRGAATEALRFMPAPQADKLLSERLLSDDSPQVRHAALFAASFRPIEPLLPAFQQVLQTDPVASVRSALVQWLGSQAGTSDPARQLLTWSSQHDPEAFIRQDAASFLLRPAR